MASDCAEENASNMSDVIVGPFVIWSVTVREEHRARVFENRVRCEGRSVGLRGRKGQETGENYIVRSCMVCVASQILFLALNEGG
jgi:hypothetical protein